MIKTNKNGFTIAEMTVVLLIMCVILAVMAPVMTTRMRPVNQNTPPSIWKYIEGSGTSDIYYGTKNLQRIILGESSVNSTDNARLIINSSDNNPNHLLLKNNSSFAGVLQLGNGNNILLGNLKNSTEPANRSIAIGKNITSTGRNSVSIGYETQVTADYSVAIGSGAKVSSPNTIVLGTNTETVNIPGYLQVQATSYPSDKRLKYVGKESVDGLDKVKKLKVYNYIYKKDAKKVPHVGVLAQDLQKIFPNAVKKGADGFLSIRTDDMFYAVINAVKELDTKISTLIKHDDEKELRIKKLEEENKALNARLKVLESKLNK